MPNGDLPKDEIDREGLIVAVSGGRDYSDVAKVKSVLDKILKERGICLLIEGECPVGDGGADELARLWAKKNQVNYLGVPPKVKKYGWPSAGPRRNREMAELKPELWVLFPGDKGTANARENALAIGCEILEVTYGD